VYIIQYNTYCVVYAEKLTHSSTYHAEPNKRVNKKQERTKKISTGSHVWRLITFMMPLTSKSWLNPILPAYGRRQPDDWSLNSRHLWLPQYPTSERSLPKRLTLHTIYPTVVVFNQAHVDNLSSTVGNVVIFSRRHQVSINLVSLAEESFHFSTV